MIKKVQGIIISEHNYSESSKIINVITKEYGIIGILAKGARRLKSNLRGVTGKLTYGYFHIYYKEDKLSTLISVDIINSFKNIKKDINKISYASFMVELTEQVIKGEFSETIYNLLISSLTRIEEGLDPLVITNILELKLLDYLGVKPNFDSCALCGNKTNIVTISSYKGGYICANCYDNEKKASTKTIKLLRLLYYVDIDKITKLEISNEVKQEINMFIDNYYDNYTGLYLKSKSFLKNLVKL
ncbi:MAG: DNA repair protein RecO [Bacilli bacterium]|nr:DNA repair protein RecO [Bacilli bacterium]